MITFSAFTILNLGEDGGSLGLNRTSANFGQEWDSNLQSSEYGLPTPPHGQRRISIFFVIVNRYSLKYISCIKKVLA